MTRVEMSSALSGIRRGEREAWNELLAVLRRRMIRLLRRRGVDEHLAEDLCQDALAVVWMKLDRVRTDERLVSWARSVLMNRLRTHIRSTRRAVELPEELPSQPRGDLDPLIRREVRTWLESRFAALKPDCRRVVSLRIGLACPPEETADLLGLSRTQVRRLLYEGIQTIRTSASSEGRALARSLGVVC